MTHLAAVREDPRSRTDQLAARKQSEIARLFAAARAGEIPRSRPLMAYEPERLNEKHLMMVMLRASGVKQRDIARDMQLLGWKTSDSNVSIILNHPDATYILDHLQALSGVEATDIEGRLQRLELPAVELVEDILNGESVTPLQAKAAFRILDRRHGAVKQVEAKVSHRFELPSQQASLLTSALAESSQIEEAEYVVLDEDSSCQS